MLSPKAQKLINDYLSLPFSEVLGVRCPYFINAKKERRGQLRSLIGKGTPAEIVEEAKIISIQYHHGIFDHEGNCCICKEQLEEFCDPKQNDGGKSLFKQKLINHFLVDNNLGIDCSGFAIQILRAHFLETEKIDIAKKFVKNIPAGFLRKLIMRLRPVESIGVHTGFCNDKNTEKLGSEADGYDYSKIKSGDVITMLETGPSKKRNHILVITNCDGKIISYVHSRAWANEGKYGHGVNNGEIKIVKPEKGLLQQEWHETSPALSPDLFNQADTNETFLEAQNARVLEIRRIKI